MQNKFDNLVENDFMEIAQSAAEAVIQERVNKSVLVNLSSPDTMIFDPIIIPEYKHITVEYENGKNILIMIGLD